MKIEKKNTFVFIEKSTKRNRRELYPFKRGEGGSHDEIEKKIFRYVVTPNHSIFQTNQGTILICCVKLSNKTFITLFVISTKIHRLYQFRGCLRPRMRDWAQIHCIMNRSPIEKLFWWILIYSQFELLFNLERILNIHLSAPIEAIKYVGLPNG